MEKTFLGEKVEREDFGTAYIEQNPMTGDWLVYGQKNKAGTNLAPPFLLFGCYSFV